MFADYADMGLYHRNHLIQLDVLSLVSNFALTNTFSSKFHKPDFSYVHCLTTAATDVTTGCARIKMFTVCLGGWCELYVL